jgi:hypothetical protein
MTDHRVVRLIVGMIALATATDPVRSSVKRVLLAKLATTLRQIEFILQSQLKLLEFRLRKNLVLLPKDCGRR